MRKSSRLRILAFVVLVAAIGVGLYFLQAYLRTPLERFLNWVRELGAWGPIVLAAAYVLACIFFIPGTLLTLGAGALFGVPKGFLAVFVGANLGAAAAFLVGRTLVRGWVEKKVAGNPKFRAIDQAIGEQGFKIVLLLRLSPVFPFTLLNYGLGLTRVSFRDYVLANLLGMLPGTLMYVYLGSAVGELADIFAGNYQGGIAQKALFFVGLAATVVVTILITRIARKALRAAVPGADSQQPGQVQGENHA